MENNDYFDRSRQVATADRVAGFSRNDFSALGVFLAALALLVLFTPANSTTSAALVPSGAVVLSLALGAVASLLGALKWRQPVADTGDQGNVRRLVVVREHADSSDDMWSKAA